MNLRSVGDRGGFAGAERDSLRSSRSSKGGGTTPFETSLNGLFLLARKFAVTVLSNPKHGEQSRLIHIARSEEIGRAHV